MSEIISCAINNINTIMQTYAKCAYNYKNNTAHIMLIMKYKKCHEILFLKYEETNKHLIDFLISLICSVYVIDGQD